MELTFAPSDARGVPLHVIEKDRLEQWLARAPEPVAAWGSGDSEIPRYRPYCSTLSHVATLKDLERAVDDVLSAYG